MSSAQDVFQTTFDFVLPRGYVDADGRVHREGTMRLATARDELVPLLDPKVRENDAFLSLVLLARVVTKLGDVPTIDDQVMGGLWATDLAFLQDLYRQINSEGHTLIEVTCPSCSTDFAVDMAGDGPGE
ncbi:MAG: hypothetical protein VW906_08685 [Actinomycetota bacterium]|jgi:hypothetical protein|nr:hypothetical protein [Actinomycetales bacterium]NDA11752.1 hypothetical protein [Actinomycetota bacterium]NKB91843.1 hypothetical protein [Candidatus Nanopelagicales bacterium]NDA49833.1 hypothetical protein [Actinomycetota bacterium]NDA59620.1 hypothetical protein [Actinomycetota bacterium]